VTEVSVSNSALATCVAADCAGVARVFQKPMFLSSS